MLVPDITWTATAAAISYVGATPVFVDIEKDSWCIDPAALEKAITSKTKAVIAVDFTGTPAEVAPDLNISEKGHLQ